jgi:hypothetical protein
MSRILVVNIDSTIPNLALKKIEKYYIDKGDEVIWDMPLWAELADKVYVSCIFPKNKQRAVSIYSEAIIGGSGYDLHIKLPPEIEAVKPRINWGFTTRGCIRKCPFCFVPKMEGYIHIVGDIYDLWDGESKEIYLMDNNILALPDHFRKICEQIRKENLRVDFNQGLDHRLLTRDLWLELLSLKHIHEIRFAFDDIAYRSTALRALELMSANGLKDWQTRWYVYVGVKDTLETVYERLNILKTYKQHAYLMRDEQVHDEPIWIALATWTSLQGAFKMDLPRLLAENDRFKGYARYFPHSLRTYELNSKQPQKVMELA